MTETAAATMEMAESERIVRAREEKGQGVQLFRSGSYEESCLAFQRAIALLNPERPADPVLAMQLQISLAMSHIAIGQSAAAMTWLTRAVSGTGQRKLLMKALFQRGKLLASMSRNAEAETDLSKATTLASEKVDRDVIGRELEKVRSILADTEKSLCKRMLGVDGEPPIEEARDFFPHNGSLP